MNILNHNNYNPRIIEWMTKYINISGISAENYTTSFLSNLDNPLHLWKHIFDNQLNDIDRYLLITLFSLSDITYVQNIKNSFNYLILNLPKPYSISLNTKDFENSILKLENNFIVIMDIDNKKYITFHNPSIIDFIKNHLLENIDYIQHLFSNLLYFSQFINLYNIFYKSKSNTDYAILTDIKHELYISANKTINETQYLYVNGNIEYKFIESRISSLINIDNENDTQTIKSIIESSIQKLISQLKNNSFHLQYIYHLLYNLNYINQSSDYYETFIKTSIDILKSNLSSIKSFINIKQLMKFRPFIFRKEDKSYIKIQFRNLSSNTMGIIQEFNDNFNSISIRELISCSRYFRVRIKDIEYIKEQVKIIEREIDDMAPDDDYFHDAWAESRYEERMLDDELESLFESLRPDIE